MKSMQVSNEERQEFNRGMGMFMMERQQPSAEFQEWHVRSTVLGTWAVQNHSHILLGRWLTEKEAQAIADELNERDRCK